MYVDTVHVGYTLWKNIVQQWGLRAQNFLYMHGHVHSMVKQAYSEQNLYYFCMLWRVPMYRQRVGEKPVSCVN